MAKRLLGLLVLWGVLVGPMAGCDRSGTASVDGEKTITILWAQWPPADALKALSEEYTRKTGVKVNVVQKSWEGAFADATQQEFRTNGTTYDLIIGDSQWLGQGAKGGHYLELTDFIKTNRNLFADVAPKAMVYYAEYPKDSGRYYAVPAQADATAWAYRRDLFEDPAHQRQFRDYLQSNGVEPFDLAPPETWEQLLWIARYFKNASGINHLNGVIMPTSSRYDTLTMMFENVLWAFGGDWGDQETNTVGIASPQTVEAMNFFNQLLETTSPGGRNATYGEVASTYIAGNAAMAANYFAFLPQLIDPTQNRDYASQTGFFNMPLGPAGRGVALGGQGFSVNAHIPPQRRQQALDYLKWFSDPQTQSRWAAIGGTTANLAVLRSEAFQEAAPYNPLFVTAFEAMKDFWSIPEYDQLLDIAQRELSAVFQQGKDPRAAADAMQAQMSQVMRKAGYGDERNR